MPQLALILADQLSETLPSFRALTREDTFLFCEVREEATYVKHHKKKIAFLFAAMRHFARECEEKGFRVRYITFNDPANTHSLFGEVARAAQELSPTRLILTKPGEYRLLQEMQTWEERLEINTQLLEDTRFLATQDEFTTWARGKKQLRMEFFYRLMRVKYKILLDEKGQPEGGLWNYDKENRKPIKGKVLVPKRLSHKKSDSLKDVLQLTHTHFATHFGTLEPFHFAVTRQQALKEFHHFIAKLLPSFGDFQDAMVKGEAYLYHSLLSTYLNAGLLQPLEMCLAAEAAYRKGLAPLNAVEGFIRQILGWREYIRGIYWHFMPQYGEMNALNAHTPLPSLYWDAHTNMACMRESITHTRDHAYSHHIQRLMITGNFALLAGLDVKEVQDWYLAVYSDAYEWVEMPNTLGMALYGDGGIVASKPYAASGSYINRMSNYCKTCVYDPNETLNEKACPFNALYWDFMGRNEALIQNNPRIPFVHKTWIGFGQEKQEALKEKAKASLKLLSEGKL